MVVNQSNNQFSNPYNHFSIDEQLGSNQQHMFESQHEMIVPEIVNPMGHEMVIESNVSPKIEAQTPKTEVTTSQSLLRGGSVGTTGSLVTTPIDRFNSLKTEQPNTKVTFSESLQNKPYKGAGTSVVTNSASMGVFFLLAPFFEKGAKKATDSNLGIYALSIAGSTTLEPVIMAPFYTVKTKLQSPGNESKTIRATIQEIHELGIRQCYRGLPMNIVRNNLFAVPYYVINREALTALGNDKFSNIQKMINATFVGGCLGSTIASISYPADVVARLQRSNKSGNEFYNKSALQIIKLIIEREGYKGFYKRGFSTVPGRMFASGGATGAALQVADICFAAFSSHFDEIKTATNNVTSRVASGTKSIFIGITAIFEKLGEKMLAEERKITEKLGQTTEEVNAAIYALSEETFKRSNRDIEVGAQLSEQLTDHMGSAIISVVKVIEKSLNTAMAPNLDDNFGPRIEEIDDANQASKSPNVNQRPVTGSANDASQEETETEKRLNIVSNF